jgi:hypothetical protein
MSTKKIQVPKANKGKGYVGVWRNGKIGWFLPMFIQGPNRSAEMPNSNSSLNGERVYLCEITIKPILDKNGRPKTKLIKNAKP